MPELWAWNPRSPHLLGCGKWGSSSLAPDLVRALPSRVTALHRSGLRPTTAFTWSPPLTVSQGLGVREFLSWAEAPLDPATWPHSFSPVVPETPQPFPGLGKNPRASCKIGVRCGQ